MAEIAASTTVPDAAVAQTRTASGDSFSQGRASQLTPFGYGCKLLPPPDAEPPRRRKKTDPLFRPLHIYALDPAQPKLDGKVAIVNVPWEPLDRGPRGRRFEVESFNRQTNADEALDLDDRSILLERGVRPSTFDGRFHKQMVYAVSSSVYNGFYKALGRELAWSINRQRLLLRPFAMEDQNAYYDPVAGELQFGYFKVAYPPAATDTIYTSLSHDIIAHELSHALLDGLRPRFKDATNPDVLAFHEALADLVAIFHHFSYPEIVRAAIRDTRGDFSKGTILSDIARQFGEGVGKKGSLRTAIDFSGGVPTTMYGAVTEPHELGAVLVAAVFDTFTRVFERKTARFVRLATGGTGVLMEKAQLPDDLLMTLAGEAAKLASQFLVICIRAVDYCPPVDITFGEYLRAVITADRDLVPDDPWAYREAWLDAFRIRGIFPDGVQHMSEDAIEWKPPAGDVVVIAELNLARLEFAGDPAHVVSAKEMQRQAEALGNVICQRHNLQAFGLCEEGDAELQGDIVDPPQIESIRSSRRIGPDGQIAFDLVAEVTQRRHACVDGSRFAMYGGATIIIGPDGEVRFVVGKSVRNRKRLDAQAKFISSGRFWAADGNGVLQPDAMPFRMLHDQARSPA